MLMNQWKLSTVLRIIINPVTVNGFFEVPGLQMYIPCVLEGVNTLLPNSDIFVLTLQENVFHV